MIKIIEDYYIEVEESPVINYVVRQGNQKTDAKGSNRDRVLGYASGLESALKIIREHLIAKRLEGGSPTLAEAIRAVKDVNWEFDYAVRMAINAPASEDA